MQLSTATLEQLDTLPGVGPATAQKILDYRTRHGAFSSVDELAEQVRLLRNYGMRNRYEIEIAGVNSRLSEIQAAVLNAKLPRLDAWNSARARIAELYSARFPGSDSIALPNTPG